MTSVETFFDIEAISLCIAIAMLCKIPLFKEHTLVIRTHLSRI